MPPWHHPHQHCTYREVSRALMAGYRERERERVKTERRPLWSCNFNALLCRAKCNAMQSVMISATHLDAKELQFVRGGVVREYVFRKKWSESCLNKSMTPTRVNKRCQLSRANLAFVLQCIEHQSVCRFAWWVGNPIRRTISPVASWDSASTVQRKKHNREYQT